MTFGFCKRKPKHIVLIKEVYPPERGIEAELITYNLNRLRLYAQTNSNKLPKIGKYLKHKAKKDIDRKRYGHCRITAEIFADLVDCCRDRIRLFSKSMLDTLSALNDLQMKQIKLALVSVFTKFLELQDTEIVPPDGWTPFINNFCSMVYCLPNEVSELRGKNAEIICFGTESMDLASCLVMAHDGLVALRAVVPRVPLDVHGPLLFAAILRTIRVCMVDLNIDPEAPQSLFNITAGEPGTTSRLLSLACECLVAAFSDISSSTLNVILRIVLNRFTVTGWYGAAPIIGLICSALDNTLTYICVLEMVSFANTLPSKTRMVAERRDSDAAIELGEIKLVSIDENLTVVMTVFDVLSSLFSRKLCSVGPSITELLTSILKCVPGPELEQHDRYLDNLHQSFIRLCGSISSTFTAATQVSDALSHIVSYLPNPSVLSHSHSVLLHHVSSLLAAAQAILDNLPVSLVYAQRPITTSMLHPLLKLLKARVDSSLSEQCVTLVATMLDTASRFSDFSKDFPGEIYPPKFYGMSSVTMQEAHSTYRNLATIKAYAHNIRDAIMSAVMKGQHDANFWVYVWRIMHAMLHELGGQDIIATVPMLLMLQVCMLCIL